LTVSGRFLAARAGTDVAVRFSVLRSSTADLRRAPAGLFLIAATTLVVEVLLTRIFDVLLWPNLSFMIISCALFGLALGGLFEMLASPRIVEAMTVPRTALLYGISVWALPPLINAIPFSLDAFGVHPASQLAWFLVLYLVLLAPFGLAGICICRLFSGASREIQRLYFWDLSGAAVGTALLIPLVPRLGPERLLLAAGLTALVASALFSSAWRWRIIAGGVAAVLVLTAAGLGARYGTLAMHDDKRGVEEGIRLGRLEYSTWDPVSYIAVLDQPPGIAGAGSAGRKYIAYDGGSLSSHFYPFDGDYAALRRDLPQRLMDHFWQRGVLASHYLFRDRGEHALVIGSAGGQEVKAARLFGAAEVEAVEMVGTVVALATDRYAGYIGHLYDDPRVHLRVGEGRSFLRASRSRYDVIQIFSNYTSSSAASGSGALTPAYLLTKEAFLEYFQHLAADGVVHINHHTYPRIITTAAVAWRALGRPDFRRHVLVFEKEDDADRLPTLLIKMTPWTAAEVDDMSRFFAFSAAREAPYRLVENPLDPAHSFLPAAFYAGTLPPALEARAPYNIGPITDDQPAFNFLRRYPRVLSTDPSVGLNASTAEHINAQLRRGWLPMDWLHLVVAGAASVFYGVLFVVAPMLLSRAGRQSWEGKAPALLYFATLGFAFILIELLFVQLFMKLIGYPPYAVATVITVMLVGAALGSAASPRIVGPASRRWALPFAGLIVSGVAIWAGYAAIAERFMASPESMRIAAAAAMILPISFFMGMPFPLGILELRTKPAGAVAWAWSMNGVCTTIGSLASVLLSVSIGFHATLLVALAMYAGAAVLFGALRRTVRQPVHETHRSPAHQRGPLQSLVAAPQQAIAAADRTSKP
jgi:hypothetical protein